MGWGHGLGFGFMIKKPHGRDRSCILSNKLPLCPSLQTCGGCGGTSSTLLQLSDALSTTRGLMALSDVAGSAHLKS